MPLILKEFMFWMFTAGLALVVLAAAARDRVSRQHRARGKHLLIRGRR